jgi:hypothetical protein
MTEKICAACKEPKSLEEDFSPRKNRKTHPYASWCRACMRLYSKEHYQRNDRAKYKETKEKHIARALSWKKSNSEKYRDITKNGGIKT